MRQGCLINHNHREHIASEMDDMGYSLRCTLEAAMARQRIARDRLNYVSGPPEACYLVMEEEWRESMDEYSESRLKSVQ